MATTKGTLFATHVGKVGSTTVYTWHLSYTASRSTSNPRQVIYKIYADYECYGEGRTVTVDLKLDGGTRSTVGSFTMYNGSTTDSTQIGTATIEKTGVNSISVTWYGDSDSGTTTFTVPSGGAPTLSVYNGTAWKDATSVSVWNGSAWKDATSVSVWNGSAWKEA